MLKKLLADERVDYSLLLAIEGFKTWFFIRLGMMMRHIIDTQMSVEFSTVVAQPGGRAGFEVGIIMIAGIFMLVYHILTIRS